MNYKIYKNEEVKNWTNAPRKFISVKDLKKSFDEFDKYRFGSFECLMTFDYIENAFNPELELDIRRVKIIDIQGYIESEKNSYYDDRYVNIVFKISKRLPEMSNKNDLYSDAYIKPFNAITLFDIDSLDVRWRLVTAINPPMFMQHMDNRIIIKQDNLQPQWWQEFSESEYNYDFSKNKYTAGNIF